MYQIPTLLGLDKIRQRELKKDQKKRQFHCLDEGSRSITSHFPAIINGKTSSKTIYTAAAPTTLDFTRVVATNSATSMEDCLKSDIPLVSCQVTRFVDGTSVSLCQSHVIGDGFSVIQILRSWQNIMENKGPPEPLQDLGLDPFLSLGPAALPKMERRPPAPSGFYLYNFRQKMQLISNLLYDMYIGRPESKMQQRYIFVPNEHIDQLRLQVEQDLQRLEARKGRSLSKEEQVSKSDILYAWLMKNSHATLPKSWYSTPLAILNVRKKKPAGVKSYPRHDFFGAAYAVPLGSLKVETLMDMPLGELALHIRQSLARHSEPNASREGIKFYLNYTAWNQSSSNDFPFFCPPNHRWSGISDWRALRLWDLDFGAAILDGNGKKSAPTIAVNASMACAMSKRDRWVCVGDSKEGSWLTGHMSIDQWRHPKGFGRYEERIHQSSASQRSSKL